MVSPKESISKDVEGTVELGSPEVNNKDLLSVKTSKTKSRNDNTTKSTILHTSKNKKSKSKLGSNAAIS